MTDKDVPWLDKVIEYSINIAHEPAKQLVTNVVNQLQQYTGEETKKLNERPSLVNTLRQVANETYENLVRTNSPVAETIVDLAAHAKPIILEGNHIAFFGLTSTGKSTMINTLLEREIAETGYGETTTKLTPYPGIGFVIWDVPGRNDEVSYTTLQYICFLKGLTRRVIVIGHTVKENSNLMKLMDAIGLSYIIVFNKYDLVPENQREKLREQVQKQIQELKLQRVDKVFYISAEQHRGYPDWNVMVRYLALLEMRN